jgi:hypothetical protein
MVPNPKKFEEDGKLKLTPTSFGMLMLSKMKSKLLVVPII